MVNRSPVRTRKDVVLVLRKARVIEWSEEGGTGELAVGLDDDVVLIKFCLHDRRQARMHGSGGVLLNGHRVADGRIRLERDDLVYVSITRDGDLIGWCMPSAVTRAKHLHSLAQPAA